MIRIVAIFGGLLLSIAWAAGNGAIALLATMAYALVMVCIGLAPIRDGLRRLTDAALGIAPATPQAPARAVAHRSEPLDLSISIPVPTIDATQTAPGNYDATIALPDVVAGLALPGAAQMTMAQPDAMAITRQAVSNLPSRVSWLVNSAKIDAIPLISDGVNWVGFNLHGAEDMVICGAKGKGKGNAIQAVTLAALALGPESVEVWYLDAKQGLDYSFAVDLRHAKLYADIPGADGSLSDGFAAALAEMKRRNDAMFKKARNYQEYAARTGIRWPIIVLVVDEAAELDAAQKGQLATMARMSRAAGFILLTCTQYPTAEVLSSQVQANAVCRLCLQMPSAKYTPVALNLAPGQKSLYEPAEINAPGIAVYRRNGDERLGRVPEVRDDARAIVIRQLVDRWARVSNHEVLSGLMFNGVSVQAVQNGASAPIGTSTVQYGTNGILPDATPQTGGMVLPMDDESVMIRNLLQSYSKNKVASLLGGSKTTAYDRIDRALGEK